VDYKKFLYDLKKKQKEIKAKQSVVEVKEIRFGPNTDEHDFNFKKVHSVDLITDYILEYFDNGNVSWPLIILTYNYFHRFPSKSMPTLKLL
jgi:hypothetical protein